MINFNELKVGDIVVAEYEGQRWEGVVTELNKDEKEVCVETAVQQFWFTPEHLYSVPMSEEHLIKLGFQKQVTEDGAAKYSKGSFRMVVPNNGEFYPLEIWWREDHRLLAQPISIHELQNHFYDMTKVELNAV